MYTKCLEKNGSSSLLHTVPHKFRLTEASTSCFCINLNGNSQPWQRKRACVNGLNVWVSPRMGSLHGGIYALTRKNTREVAVFLLCHVRDTARRHHLANQEAGSCQGTTSICLQDLSLDFPASRTGGNTFLLFMTPSLWSSCYDSLG